MRKWLLVLVAVAASTSAALAFERGEAEQIVGEVKAYEKLCPALELDSVRAAAALKGVGVVSYDALDKQRIGWAYEDVLEKRRGDPDACALALRLFGKDATWAPGFLKERN